MSEILYQTVDTYVDEGNPTTNYGTATTLPLYNTGSRESQVLLAPDISSVTDDETAIKYELNIFLTTSISAVDVKMWRCAASWSESTVTWNTKPSHYLPAPEWQFTCDGTKYYTKDITHQLNMWNLGFASDYGYKFTATTSVYNTPAIGSSDHTNSNYRPYIEVTTFEDVGYEYEAYSDEYDTIFDWSPTGNSFIEWNSTNQSNYSVNLDIKVPWSSSFDYNVILDVDESKTYSNSGTGYTDYFKVTNYSTAFSGEIGYYAILKVEYYREYNDRYVKTDGDDDDNGLSWDYAFASIEKGFEATPDGGTLYIESGLYSETLANIGLASGNTEINIVPMNESHISSDYSAIAIGTGTIINIGAIISNSTSSISGHDYLTIIDTQHVIPSTTNIQLFDSILYSSSNSVLQVRIVSYNLSGGIYTPINFGEWSQDISISGVTEINNIYSGVDVTAYDTIGLQIKYVSGATQFGWRKYYTATVDTYLWVSDTEMDGSLDTSNTDATYTGYRTPMILHYFT